MFLNSLTSVKSKAIFIFFTISYKIVIQYK